MTDTSRPSFSTGIAYRDPRAALAWLEKAFGFETTMVVEGEDGAVVHSEMRFGDGMIMVGQEWDALHKSPASLGGVNTQSVHVQITTDIDAHCARARSAGAVIIREPADQFYGDRLYAAVDPEGHQWSFGQTVTAMSQDEMSKAGGVAVRERL
jgi:uncharacterized glyoxalase superfamily protein PhnB